MMLHVATSRLLGQFRRGLEKGKHRIKLPSLTLLKDLTLDIDMDIGLNIGEIGCYSQRSKAFCIFLNKSLRELSTAEQTSEDSTVFTVRTAG